MVSLPVDPSILLLAGWMLLPLYFAQDITEAIGFIFHQYHFAAAFILFFLTRLANKKIATNNIAPLSSSEQWQATWWLLNGVFIHFIMDGCSYISLITPKILASFSSTNIPNFPPYIMHSLYSRMDTRYLGHPLVDTVSILELFVMGPMSCALYYGLVTRASWRTPLQLLTSTLQLVGTIIYFLPEAFEHFIHIPYFDWELEFSFNHIIFFWTTFVSIIFWVIIPCYLIYVAFYEITDIIEMNVGNIIPLSQRNTFVFSPQAFLRQQERMNQQKLHHHQQQQHQQQLAGHNLQQAAPRQWPSPVSPYISLRRTVQHESQYNKTEQHDSQQLTSQHHSNLQFEPIGNSTPDRSFIRRQNDDQIANDDDENEDDDQYPYNEYENQYTNRDDDDDDDNISSQDTEPVAYSLDDDDRDDIEESVVERNSSTRRKSITRR